MMDEVHMKMKVWAVSSLRTVPGMILTAPMRNRMKY